MLPFCSAVFKMPRLCRVPTWLTLCIGVLLLSGCASSVTPPDRYLLPVNQDGQVTTTAQHRLLLRQPRLANYLEVDGIIMQLDDITLNEAREHLWAEGLGRQLEQRMRTSLGRLLPETQVLRDTASSDGLRLQLEVDTFQGRYDGYAVVAGQWQLLDAEGRTQNLESFHVETVLEEDGYPALVRALGRSWEQVASELALAICRLQTAP
ncbi:ABC-type transport auxiliary lipoprotein family protein [Halomonas sp. Bachu 37]|uniref:PqiC family protein n=1 Tax=Halomonas kashgarensis TaxID=3084920 RepID=UPI003217CEB1